MNLSDKQDREQAIAQMKEMISHLENEEVDAAQAIMNDFNNGDKELFNEVGHLTRQLYDSLNNFNLDSKIIDMTAQGIPSARERLNYVIESTENAANTTMDKVEECNLLTEKLIDESDTLIAEWDKLYRRELDVSEFKNLCGRIGDNLNKNKTMSLDLKNSLSDVLMAQGYQDLTSQVIRQVIELVQDVEDNMINIIKVFGDIEEFDQAKGSMKKTDSLKAEGPIVDADKRDDVVSNQDEVDDLLSSLGF
jgi:chemotaxis protein CheZ